MAKERIPMFSTFRTVPVCGRDPNSPVQRSRKTRLDRRLLVLDWTVPVCTNPGRMTLIHKKLIHKVSLATCHLAPVTIWKLGKIVCVYSVVQRNERRKKTRDIHQASAPAAGPSIRPITSCTSVTRVCYISSGGK